MRLGIIARSDDTGLGNQTRELVQMLNPSLVMLINSESFNGNEQHPEWYKDYNVKTSQGFLTDRAVRLLLDNVDVILSCEIFYNDRLIRLARKYGVKTILQYNYEFLEHIDKPEMDLPDVMLAPSVWNIENVRSIIDPSKTKLLHIPPPTTFSLFDQAREVNLSKDHNRLLHIAGKIAAKDRNGTQIVLDMLKYSKADYELVIKVQKGDAIVCNDPRVTIDTGNVKEREDLYSGFDGMILPRRYAGLCLPMNEALMSGLPVFMPNISPNNDVLPSEWLTEAKRDGSFRAKSRIDLYEADSRKLAELVDNYINSNNKINQKQEAIDIGYSRFAPESLKEKYLEVISQTVSGK